MGFDALTKRLQSDNNVEVGGAVLAWGIIAPILIKTGAAVGLHVDEENPTFMLTTAMSFKDPELYSKSPSPRYWLLWPGVFIMLVYSFADILVGLIPMIRGEHSLAKIYSV